MKWKIIVQILVLFMLCFFIDIVIADEPTDLVSLFQNSSTLYVGGTGEGNYSSIQTAISTSINGDTIIVYPNIYRENLVVNKSIRILGMENYGTIIQGNGLDNVIEVTTDNVYILNLLVENSGNPPIWNASGSSNETNSEVTNKFDIGKVPINFSGIYSEGDNVSIVSCVFHECDSGLIMRNCSSNHVEENIFYENDKAGYVINSMNFVIKNCTIRNNGLGFYIHDSEIGQCAFCSFLSNKDTGLILSNSDYNVIQANGFENNSISIILSGSSYENMFLRNNFVQKRAQFHVIDNGINQWDNGISGNYWDDYVGEDADGDGIGDQPYVINIVNEDAYPFINEVEVGYSVIGITIFQPKKNEFVSGEIVVNGTVSSVNNISSVMIKVDDEAWFTAEGNEHWQVEINTLNYDDGVHMVYIAVSDSMGYQAYDSLKITINNEIDSHKNGTSDDVPGFSFYLFIVASVVMLLVVIKRK